jgi:Holliday junction resolvasome RuvABC DNA-binding subunit
MEGVGEKTAQILEAHRFKTVQDILGTDVEKLSTLPGIGAKRAEKLIQSAKQYLEGKRT